MVHICTQGIIFSCLFWFDFFVRIFVHEPTKDFNRNVTSSPNLNNGTMEHICTFCVFILIFYFCFLFIFQRNYFSWFSVAMSQIITDCADMPAEELSTLISLSRANYSLKVSPCFANAGVKVWENFMECRQWRGCKNPFLCTAFLFPWFCKSKTPVQGKKAL